MSKLIGILTSGGDTPGLNSAIRAVGKTLLHEGGYTLIGYLDGYRGLMENRFVELNDAYLSGIITQGGTILGSSRDKPHKMPVGGKIMDMTDVIVENYHSNHLSGLVCLGGGGTQKNSYRLANAGLNILTLPKTIDNDIVHTDVSFGYDTAMMIATEAVDRLHSTASSHHRIIILETMGHKVGWLALGAGIAGGADVILLPEIPYDEQVVADAILRRTREGKKFSIVVVAEGAMSTSMAKVLEEKGGKDKVEEMLKTRTPQLAAHLERLTGREARVTILGYVQRGGTPTPYDRLLSTSLGSRCAQEIMKDKWGNMMAVQNNQIVTVPLEKVAGPIKYIPKDHYLLTCVKDIGVCLGS
ncbi:6-phosphofructokinase [Sphaerochaeta halotolerans]|uniref:6-phosphofructokinase n=1 Tax=Sphaerochaeta halotolerans TaxID=2293840 RepID=UPI00136FD124|nr:ATP-dependent 6-phosphofructokinase [Sphaerochaeta halotolerans]MXI86282.1 ATP-dependent 6-phosphofructokinase [Sphaerochaeta halotolerans]